ncbi:MAG: ATP-binding protein [Sandaracinaceae bacterium]
MRSLHLKLSAAFAASLLVLSVGGAGLFAFEQEREALAAMRRSRALVDAVRELREALLDAETGQRGFLLTEDDRYSVPWEDARRRMRAMVEDFAAASETAGVAPGLVSRARELVQMKLDEMEVTIRMADHGDRAGALAIVETDLGLARMTELRSILSEIEGHESDKLQRRRSRLDDRRAWAELIVVAGTASAFALLMLVYAGIRSSIQREEQRQAELIEKTHALAEGHVELAQKNEELERQLAKVAELGRELSIKNSELATRNRDLDQFAYVASHDLRAPLRGIANLAHWIEEDLGEAIPDESREHLALLKGRITRMEGLIDGVLQYSRAGRDRGELIAVDAAKVVRDVVDLLGAEDDEEEHRVEIDPRLEGLQLLADGVQLRQVVQNLVSNAIKHARTDDRRIAVGGRAIDDELAELYVRDNGPGIEPRFHERIFGIFQTLAPRDEIESTGIGLAVVKKIVERAGGTVRLESEAGKGACFYFTWPLARDVSDRTLTGGTRSDPRDAEVEVRAST